MQKSSSGSCALHKTNQTNIEEKKKKRKKAYSVKNDLASGAIDETMCFKNGIHAMCFACWVDVVHPMVLLFAIATFPLVPYNAVVDIIGVSVVAVTAAAATSRTKSQRKYSKVLDLL